MRLRASAKGCYIRPPWPPDGASMRSRAPWPMQTDWPLKGFPIAVVGKYAPVQMGGIGVQQAMRLTMIQVGGDGPGFAPGHHFIGRMPCPPRTVTCSIPHFHPSAHALGRDAMCRALWHSTTLI